MELQSSQFLNCSDLPSVSQLKLANLIHTLSSCVGLLVLLLLLALLILYRAYHSTLQRLFLALTLVTALNIAVTVLSVELQFNLDPRLCQWIGLGNVWTGNLIELFSLALTVYLTGVTYQQLRGKRCRCTWRKLSRKRHRVAAELACLTLLALLPLSYIWVPAYYHSYGRGETVCWIKTRETDCQASNGSSVTFITTEVFDVALHLVVIVAFLALLVTFSVKMIKLKHLKEQKVVTLRRVAFLIASIFVSTAIRVAQLLVNLSILAFKVRVNNFLYDAIDSTVYTVSNLLVPVGFGVYLYSPRKLGIKAMKKAAQKWLCCKRVHSGKMKKVKVVPKGDHIDDDEGLESVESSIERNVPSHTTYSSPYTNEFTDITEIVSSQECRKTVPKYYGAIEDT